MLAILPFLSGAAQAANSTQVFAGYHSLSNGRGTTLTINARSKSALLRKHSGYLKVSFSRGKSIYTFVKTDPNKISTLILKAEGHRIAIGFFQKPNEISYIANCATEDKISKLKTQIEKITSFTSSKDIEDIRDELIDASCDDSLRSRDQNRLKTVALETATNGSYLSECLANPDALAKFSRIKGFEENIELAVNELTNMQSLTKNKKIPFKIACESVDMPAKFIGKYQNNIITVPTAGKILVQNDCVNLRAVISHEILHKAGVVDEKKTAIFDAICASVLSKESVENEACLNQYSMKQCIKEPEGCGISSQLAIDEAVKVAKESEQQQAALIAKKEVESASIKQLSITDKEWEALGSSQETQLSAAATRSIASVMSSNYDTFAKAVDRTVGAIESQAYAGPTLASSKTTYSGRSTREKTSNDYYTTEEYYADKYPEFQQAAVGSDRSSESTTQSVQGKSSPLRDQSVPAELGNGEVGKAGIQDGPSGQSSELAANDSNEGFVGQKSSASRSTAQRDIQSRNGSQVLGVLQRDEVITGSQYKVITDKYNDPSFFKELREEGVSISISSEGINLGQNPTKATLHFVDDGKSLKRVKGK